MGDFNWARGRLFDEWCALACYELVMEAPTAVVTKVRQAPTSKWRPLPLATVDMEMRASRFLRMDSATTMKIAEKLYQRGILSYPRTETEVYQDGFDLEGLIREQTSSPE